MIKRFIQDADRIFLAYGTTNFRKQIPGLVAMVQMQFQLDPYQGSHVFLFCNKKKDGIKVLRYDSNGFVLATKKLLDGMKFQWSKNDSGDFIFEDNHISKAGNTCLRYYLGEATNSVRRHVPKYAEFYSKKYAEVTKHPHKRALALTSRKFVRLVFCLLVKNQLYTGEKLDTKSNSTQN